MNYHDRPEMSYSKLKVFCESPRLYEAQYITGEMQRPKSKEMEVGSLVHAMICEPSVLSQYMLILESVLAKGGARKGGKWEEFAEQNSDKFLFKIADYDEASRCADKVRSHPIAKALLNATSSFEQELYWKHEASGVSMRCKLDMNCESIGRLVDLKTCQDSSPDEFAKAINNFKYHLQAATYLDAAEENGLHDYDWDWIAVETNEPYRVRCYSIDQETLTLGRELMDKSLAEFASRQSSGDWSDRYEDKLVSIGLPAWVIRKEFYAGAN